MFVDLERPGWQTQDSKNLDDLHLQTDGLIYCKSLTSYISLGDFCENSRTGINPRHFVRGCTELLWKSLIDLLGLYKSFKHSKHFSFVNM